MDRTNRKNVAVLSCVLFVVMLGYGMMTPLFPFYIDKMGAGGTQLGMLNATSALLELLFAPFWGSVSDRTGRKPIILLGLFGYGLSSLLFGLSTRLWMLFASRALAGILSSAMSATTLAFLSDSLSNRERSGGMGITASASALGRTVGPVVGGWVGGRFLALPFYIATGFSLLAMALAALWLPESLSIRVRGQAIGWTANGMHELRRGLAGPVGLLLFLLFLVSFALANFESVFGLYAAQVLNYGPERVGTLLTVVGVISTLGKAVLIGPLTRRWGDALIIRVSLAASTVGFLILLWAASYPAVLVATGIFILSKALLRVVIISLASKRVVEAQGTVMGWSNSFMNLGAIVGPLWGGFMFDMNTHYPYLGGAAIMFIGFLISMLWISMGQTPKSELQAMEVVKDD